MQRRRSILPIVVTTLIAVGGAGGASAASPAPSGSGITAPVRVAFATPEDAVQAYLRGVAAADVDTILGATAVDEMVAGFDFEAYTERLRAMSLTTSLAPADYPFYATIDQRLQVSRIMSQTLMLAYSLLSGLEIGPPVIVADRAKADEFVRAVDPSRLADLALIDVRFPNASMERDPNWLSNAASVAASYGADEMTERLALVSLDGRTYAVGFTPLRYGDVWKVANQTSTLAGTSALGAAQQMTRADYDRLTSGG